MYFAAVDCLVTWRLTSWTRPSILLFRQEEESRCFPLGDGFAREPGSEQSAFGVSGGRSEWEFDGGGWWCRVNDGVFPGWDG